MVFLNRSRVNDLVPSFSRQKKRLVTVTEQFLALLVQYLLNGYGTLSLVFIRTINIEDVPCQIDLFYFGLILFRFLGNKPYDLSIAFV